MLKSTGFINTCKLKFISIKHMSSTIQHSSHHSYIVNKTGTFKALLYILCFLRWNKTIATLLLSRQLPTFTHVSSTVTRELVGVSNTIWKRNGWMAVSGSCFSWWEGFVAWWWPFWEVPFRISGPWFSNRLFTGPLPWLGPPPESESARSRLVASRYETSPSASMLVIPWTGVEQNLRIEGTTVSEYPDTSTWEGRKPPSRSNPTEAVFNLKKTTECEKFETQVQSKNCNNKKRMSLI